MLSNNQPIDDDVLNFNFYLKKAEQGNAHAEYLVGICYEGGIGVKKDEKQAFNYFKKAADQGHEEAQCSLGFFYLKGKGIEKNLNAAFNYFKKSADQGHADAQSGLGFLYSEGKGIEKNLNAAFNYYKKAADQGHAEAQSSLGLLYLEGKGIEKNLNAAFNYFKKAADQGCPEGQFYLAICYLFGYGVKLEEKSALYYFHEAAKQDYALSLNWIKNFSTKDKLLLKSAEKSKDCYMPKFFPQLVNQIGPYCGSAAFAGGCNYARTLDFPLYASIHEKNIARVAHDENAIDVVVEQLNRTRFPSDGPQYSVQSFLDLAELYKVPNCTAVVLPEDSSEEKYRDTLIQAFRENYVLILACDHQDHMPKPNDGESTHWALGFGYWRDKKGDYKIAVTHHGLYCKWDLHDLYESNKLLPEKNPLLENGSLKDFRFSFFKIKVKEKSKYEMLNHEDVNLKLLTPGLSL